MAITGKHVIKSLSDVVTNSTTQMIVILSSTNLYYIYRPHPRIKPVTRKESKKIVNARLADLGVNFKITHLPHSTMKHISHELGERRQKLKEVNKFKHLNLSLKAILIIISEASKFLCNEK